MGDQYRAMTARSWATRLPATMVLAIVLLAGGSVWAASAPRLVWHLQVPARGVPAHDDVSVYFLTHAHELVSASLSRGQVQWRLVLDRTSPTFGSRVVVHGETVVAGDYDLVGVDRRSGRRRWQFTAADGGGAGMYLGGTTDDLVLTGSLSGVMRGISVAAGTPRWTVPVGPAATTTVYAPVVNRELAAAVFTDFGLPSVGGLVVVDTRTGRKLWQRVVPGSVGASGSPAFADGKVWTASRDGVIHAFDLASGDSRGSLADQRADSQDYRPLAAAGRILVAGSLSGGVVAWDVRSRRVLWRRQAEATSVAFGVAVQNESVFVPYVSNQLVALRLRDGRELWRLGTPTARYRWLPSADRTRLLATGSRVMSLYRYEADGRAGEVVP